MAPNNSLQHMETAWFRVLFAGAYAFWHMVFTLGFSIRMRGRRNLPLAGPALIVANHQSFFDPLIIGIVAQRPLVYLARKTLFRNRFFGAIIRTMNAVPIDQEGVGKDGIRVILEQLQLGRAVVVFPEGTRTPDGTMQPLKAGIHLIIKRTQAPIIPVGIAGAYDAWPIWRACPIPAPVFWPASSGCLTVVMGKPLDARRFVDMPRDEALQVLFHAIAEEQQRAEELKRH